MLKLAIINADKSLKSISSSNNLLDQPFSGSNCISDSSLNSYLQTNSNSISNFSNDISNLNLSEIFMNSNPENENSLPIEIVELSCTPPKI